MPVRHRVLLVVWALIFAMELAGLVFDITVFASLPFIAVMVAAPLTYRAVDPKADLRYRRTYYALTGLLLITASTAAIACGSTLAFSAKAPVVGLIALGATNLVVAILAWRAIVTPSTRRVALAGLVAACSECVAMIVDVLMNLHVPNLGPVPAAGIGLMAALASIVTGSLACVAALVTFGPDLPDVPEARAV